MSLRDLAIFMILGAVVLIAPRRPFIGALVWVLFGVMNPHRLTWGIAYSFPVAQVIAIATLFGALITKEHRQWKGGAAAAMLMIFLLWNCLTTIFAFNLTPAVAYLFNVSKIFVMTFVLLALTHTRQQVIAIVATLAVALGFYGVKGGIFVLATGGAHMVNGPPGSVMDGNNSLGVGLTMVIPLLYFLSQQLSKRWQKYLLFAAMALCSAAVLGTYSRGAMLAIAAMGALLWLRSSNKILILIFAVLFVMVGIAAMPPHWVAKMDTLATYKDDASAMFRLYAWETAYNIAKDKFPLAGGFEWESPAASLRYSPLTTLVLVPHSIYFQVIGSQGFIGLVMYLTFWALVWKQTATLRKLGRRSPDDKWAFQLGSMVQVSLIGYFVGGAFLDLAFWDLPYYLFAAVAAANYALAAKKQSALPVRSAVAAPLPAPQPPRPAGRPARDSA